MKNTQINKLLVTAILNAAKISRPEVKFTEAKQKLLFNFFNDINALDYTATMFKGQPLSEWLIPDCLSFLLMPRSVRLVAGDTRMSDYLDRPQVSGNDYTMLDVINLWTTLAGLVRKDKLELVSIQQVRADVSLVNVVGDIVIADGDDLKASFPENVEKLPNIFVKMSDFAEESRYPHDYYEIFNSFLANKLNQGALLV